VRDEINNPIDVLLMRRLQQQGLKSDKHQKVKSIWRPFVESEKFKNSRFTFDGGATRVFWACWYAVCCRVLNDVQRANMKSKGSQTSSGEILLTGQMT
jgi:hypothetical protein